MMSFYHTIKSFKGISFIRFLKYVIIIDILLILYVKFIAKNYIKDQENQLSTYDIIKIYTIRFIHYGFTLITWFYPWIVKHTFFMDIIYILCVSVGILSFYHNKCCILSKIEAETLDSSYIQTNSQYQPYYIVFTNGHNDCIKFSKMTWTYTQILFIYVITRAIYHLLHKK